MNFDDIIKYVKNISLKNFKNKDVPFEKLIEILRPDRDLSRTPIFQVVLNVLNLLKGHKHETKKSSINTNF